MASFRPLKKPWEAVVLVSSWLGCFSEPPKALTGNLSWWALFSLLTKKAEPRLVRSKRTFLFGLLVWVCTVERLFSSVPWRGSVICTFFSSCCDFSSLCLSFFAFLFALILPLFLELDSKTVGPIPSLSLLPWFVPTFSLSLPFKCFFFSHCHLAEQRNSLLR